MTPTTARSRRGRRAHASARAASPTATACSGPTCEAEWYEDEDYLGRDDGQPVDITRERFLQRMPGLNAPALPGARPAGQHDQQGIRGARPRSGTAGTRCSSATACRSRGKARTGSTSSRSKASRTVRRRQGRAPEPGVKTVRLISLFNWSFTCVPDGGHSFNNADAEPDAGRRWDGPVHPASASPSTDAACPTDDENVRRRPCHDERIRAAALPHPAGRPDLCLVPGAVLCPSPRRTSSARPQRRDRSRTGSSPSPPRRRP